MNFNTSSKAFSANLVTSTTHEPIICQNDITKDVESKTKARKGSPTINRKSLRKQMTSIGRFSLSSQTEENPSIISFFVALVHKDGKDMSMEAFNKIWNERIVSKYERFRFHICKEDSRYFELNEKTSQDFVSKVQHPTSTCGDGFKKRIESMLVTPMNVNMCLWDLQLSSGDLGSSGALKTQECLTNNNAAMTRESLLLFRVHHSLCDAVSLSVAIGELADESKQLKENIFKEISKRMNAIKTQERSIIVTGIIMIVSIIRFVLLSFLALSLQLWRVVTTSSPFDNIMDSSTIPPGERSVAWRHLDTLHEMKKVSKTVTSSMTINDLAVHLVTHAIQCQLDEHSSSMTEHLSRQDCCHGKNRPTSVNIVIPVHLNGGFIKEEDLGNKIGAFVSTVPLPGRHKDSISRAAKISQILHRDKSSPAALISWWLAKFSSDFAPDWWTKLMMRKFNAKSVAVVSNVKGWPFQVHWLGRKVGFLCAFLPLPPGIPIGIILQSYGGNVSLSINADRRAVPDANKFIEWMIEEYHNMMIKNE